MKITQKVLSKIGYYILLVFVLFGSFSSLSFLPTFFHIQKVSAATTVPQSGTWGTIVWSLDNAGNLTLGTSGASMTQIAGTSAACPWGYNATTPLGSSIYTINIVSPISAGASSTALYGFFTNAPGGSGNGAPNGNYSSSNKMLNLTSITGLANLVVNPGQNPAGLFAGLAALQTIDLPSNFVTRNMTNLSYMFNGDKALQTVDVSNWDLSNVTSIASLFSGCSSIKTLNVSNWNTSNINTSPIWYGNGSSYNYSGFDNAFSNMSNLTGLDVSKWALYTGTPYYVNMEFAFYNDPLLNTLAVDNWNTSRVNNLSYTFAGDSVLTALNVATWDTGSVTDMSYTFQKTSHLTALNVANWNISNVNYFPSMFSGSGITSFDFTNWTFNATVSGNWASRVDQMLATAKPITKIIIGSGFKQFTNMSISGITSPYNAWAFLGNGTVAVPEGPFYMSTPPATNYASSTLMAATNLAAGTYLWANLSTITLNFLYGPGVSANNPVLVNNGFVLPTTPQSLSGVATTPVPWPVLSNSSVAPVGFKWTIQVGGSATTYTDGAIPAYLQLTNALSTFSTAQNTPISATLNALSQTATFNQVYPNGNIVKTEKTAGSTGNPINTPSTAIITAPPGYTISGILAPNGTIYTTLAEAIASQTYQDTSTSATSNANTFKILLQFNYGTPVLNTLTTYKNDPNFTFPSYKDPFGQTNAASYQSSGAIYDTTTHSWTNTWKGSNTGANWTITEVANQNTDGSWGYLYTLKDSNTGQLISSNNVTSTIVQPSAAGLATTGRVTIPLTLKNTITIPSATVGTDQITAATIGTISGPDNNAVITAGTDGTVNFKAQKSGTYTFVVTYTDTFGNITTATDTIYLQANLTLPFTGTGGSDLIKLIIFASALVFLSFILLYVHLFYKKG